MSNATGNGRSSRAEAGTDALAYARSIVETVREPLVILDSRLRVQSASHAFYHTFEVSPQDAHDRLLYDIGDRQWDIPRLRTLLDELLSHDTSFSGYDIEHDFPAIGRKVMLLNARRLQHEGAELILLAIEDVTERRRAEQTMQASEQRLRMALDAAYTLAFEWDIPRNEVWRHHSRIEAVPETPEERPSSLEEFCAAVHPDDRESFLADLHAALAHPERGYRAEFRLCEPDGRILWLAEHGYLECDGQGQPQRLIALSQDITERKAAEDALRASEVRYRTLVEATCAVTWSCPPSGLQVAPQPEWMGFTGQTAEQMLGTGWSDAIHPEDVARATERWQDAVARGVPFVNEHRIRRHDGEWRCVRAHAAPIRDARGEMVEWIGMNLDITERKRSEEAALAANELARQRLTELEDLYHNAPVGLCLLDRDLRFLRINERLAEINGIPAAEHLGKTVREVLPMLADTVEPAFREVMSTGQALLGNEVVGETLARPGVRRTWLEHSLPVKDSAGRVIGVSIVVEEITERKQAEAALLEADSRKDAFLATLAHELRNPLAPIRAGLDLVEALRGDAAACEEPVRMMDRQVTHLVRLVDDLLDVSRISRGKIKLRKERLELAAVIDAALEISDSGLRRGDRQLAVSVPSEPLAVEGDRVRLVQIVANLLNNAVRFTDAGGRIDVRVMPRGERVEIRVQDDGCGIQRELLGNIFEMFSQAEPGHGGGLGIGLPLVRELVEMHGGTVCADSEGPGCGATFTVSLPLCDSAPKRAPDTATALGVLPTPCRVLVVDDNRDIAKGLHLVLTMMGAEVRVAHDGAEAVGVFEDWPPTHVLMDIGMPGMDGHEAARRLRAHRHPDRAFRLIAVTGWGQEEDRQRAREAGFDEHLVKPVGVAELKAVLSC
jgi:PAS domain S-box-containing protein